MVSPTSRRAVLVAFACAPGFAFAATERPKKRVGFIGPGNKEELMAEYQDVLSALGKLGYSEGRNLEVLAKPIGPFGVLSPQALESRLKAAAEELVAARPDVIIAKGSGRTTALHRATRSIPIVTWVGDPVSLGFASSLARPGGNVTGLALGIEVTATKMIELMRLFIPRLARVGMVHYDHAVSRHNMGFLERAARAAGLEPAMIPYRENVPIPRAFDDLAARRIQVANWALFPEGDEVRAVARAAIERRIALFTNQEEWVEGGFLASFSGYEPDIGSRMAAVVDKIFAGANPAEIPFQFPQRFRYWINRRTATALGIALTPELLLRADRVIN